MIVLWMLYAMLIAAWFGLAALLAERAMRWLGRGARFVWLAALLLSTAVPIGAVWFASSRPAQSSAVVGSLVQREPNVLLAILDRGVLIGWLVAVLALSIAATHARIALVKARRSWRSADMQGTQVLISRDFGPGVIGFGRARIVVPEWALEIEARMQELMLRHEREHLRAGDPLLIVLGLGLLVLSPFNPFLWWQFSRLKLAIEMDCDARVLSGRQDVREYAALLLDVGKRGRTARLVSAAFAAPPHAIERRIRMILHRKPRARRLAVVLTAAGAVVVGVLACQTPEPNSPEPAVRDALGLSEPTGAKPHQSEGKKAVYFAEGTDGVYKTHYDPGVPVIIKAGAGLEVDLDLLVVCESLGKNDVPESCEVAEKKPHPSEQKKASYNLLRKLRQTEVEKLPPPPPPPPPRPVGGDELTTATLRGKLIDVRSERGMVGKVVLEFSDAASLPRKVPGF